MCIYTVILVSDIKGRSSLGHPNVAEMGAGGCVGQTARGLCSVPIHAQPPLAAEARRALDGANFADLIYLCAMRA